MCCFRVIFALGGRCYINFQGKVAGLEQKITMLILVKVIRLNEKTNIQRAMKWADLYWDFLYIQ